MNTCPADTMASYAVADIHGNYDALVDVLDSAGFDPGADRLIVLGDVVDYGSQTRKCIEYLLGVPDKVMVMGNHDLWFLEWIATGNLLDEWVSQGGFQTLQNYGSRQDNVPLSHVNLIGKALPYYEDGEGRLFVHGGFDPSLPIRDQHPEELMWDRKLIHFAMQKPVPGYTRIFVGHSPTQQFGRNYPMMLNNLILCDTGARLGECLTLIDVESLRFWQSEKTERWGR